jgi:16S rRNA (cytidine1402-2'-O)-methyltransferase
LHADNESGRIREILVQPARNEMAALVSDAGIPLISDSGARLVAAEQSYEVEGVPGPSAIVTALSVCGLRVHPFTFLGFLPRRIGPRRRLIEGYRDRSETLVIFEVPNRLGRTLSELAEWLGSERRARLTRELTKAHEQVVRDDLGELSRRFADPVRGEITLVVEGGESSRSRVARPMLGGQEVEQRIQQSSREGKRPREIAAHLAGSFDLPRREIYARAVVARGALERAEAAESGCSEVPRE